MLIPYYSLRMNELNSSIHRRNEEAIIHVPELQQALGAQREPDAIYGLLNTERMSHYLQAIGTQRPDVKFHQPLADRGNPLLFPFLVVEAKSGVASDTWESIRLQTAFAIRELLQCQHYLFQDVGVGETAPLVWFIANKGSNWRVSVALAAAVAGSREINTVS